MTTIEKAALDAAVSEAFRGGEVVSRELRLSPAQAEHLRTYAQVSPMWPGGEEKGWYRVTPKGAMKHE